MKKDFSHNLTVSSYNPLLGLQVSDMLNSTHPEDTRFEKGSLRVHNVYQDKMDKFQSTLKEG